MKTHDMPPPRCNTCGQDLVDKQAIIKYHVSNLEFVMDLIDSGHFFVEDFPQLQRIGKLLQV